LSISAKPFQFYSHGYLDWILFPFKSNQPVPYLQILRTWVFTVTMKAGLFGLVIYAIPGIFPGFVDVSPSRLIAGLALTQVIIPTTCKEAAPRLSEKICIV